MVMPKPKKLPFDKTTYIDFLKNIFQKSPEQPMATSTTTSLRPPISTVTLPTIPEPSSKPLAGQFPKTEVIRQKVNQDIMQTFKSHKPSTTPELMADFDLDEAVKKAGLRAPIGVAPTDYLKGLSREQKIGLVKEGQERNKSVFDPYAFIFGQENVASEQRFRERLTQDPNTIIRWANTPTGLLGLTPTDIVGIGLIAKGGFDIVRSLTEFGRLPQVKALNQFAKTQNIPKDSPVYKQAVSDLRSAFNLYKGGASEAADAIIAKFNRAYNIATGVPVRETTLPSTPARVPALPQRPIPKGTLTGALNPSMAGKAFKPQPPTVPSVAQKITQNIPMTEWTPEEIQFRENNKVAIENALKANAPIQQPAKTPQAKEPWQMSSKEWQRQVTELGKEIDDTTPATPEYRAVVDRMQKLVSDIADGEGTGAEKFATHKDVIVKALSEGKPVPPEVLKDYPDLQAKAPVAPLHQALIQDGEKIIQQAEKISPQDANLASFKAAVEKAKSATDTETRTTALREMEKLEPEVQKIASEPVKETTQPPIEPPKPPVQTALMPEGEPFSIKDYTPEQIDALTGVFGEYLSSPSVEKAWQLTQELRHEFRAQQSQALKESVQRLMADKDLTPEQSLKIAIKEVLSQKLPKVTTEYFKGITDDLKQVLIMKVANELKNEPFEMASTLTALENALAGKPIPAEPGIKGGSALTRLQRVFGNQPKLMEGIQKITEEKKSLENVVEGIFREPGQPPIPIDEQTALYLNSLASKPLGQIRLGEEPWTPPSVVDPRSDVEKELARLKLQRSTEKAEGRLPPIDAEDIAFLRSLSGKSSKQIGMLPQSQIHRVYELLRRIGLEMVDILGIPKAVKFAIDISYPGRQGLVLGVRHPIAWAKAWSPMIKALRNEKIALELDHQIRTDPEGMIAIERLGLDLYDVRPGSPYMKRPETVSSKLAEKYIPGVRMSGRAAAIYSNNLMADVGKHAIKVLDNAKADTNEYKAFGEYINWAMGRGTLPKKLDEAAGLLNTIFTSPRWFFSRVELPAKLASSSPIVRREGWQTLIAFLTLSAMVFGIGRLAGAEIEKDPRSADAFKLKIGNKRIDWWVGYAQMLRFIAQLSTGEVKTRDGKIIKAARSEIIGRYLQSKESPGIGALVSLLSGKSFTGDTLDFSKTEGWIEFSKDTLAPAAVEEMVDAYRQEGLPSAIGSGVGLVGIGVSTYGGALPLIPEVLAEFGKLGSQRTDDLEKEIELARKRGASPSQISDIRAKDWVYDIRELGRNINKITSETTPNQRTVKSGFSGIVEDYWDYNAKKESYNKLGVMEQSAYLKNNPDFVAGKVFWGETVTIPDFKTAETVAKQAEKYGIKLDLIPAFQKKEDGTERIPSDRNLWSAYFDYQDLPGGGGYLSYSEDKKDEIPEQYRSQWETFQKLSPQAKTIYRNTHKAASKNLREDLRKKNKALDKWLVEQGTSPLTKTISQGTPSSIRLGALGGVSGIRGAGVRPRASKTTFGKVRKLRVKTSTNIRAPRAI